jgi:hypothetical protein
VKYREPSSDCGAQLREALYSDETGVVEEEEEEDRDKKNRERPPKSTGSSSGWGEEGRSRSYPWLGAAGEDGAGGKGFDGGSTKELSDDEDNVLTVVDELRCKGN